mmetsp:Transcript_94974/g.198493  ORF Transcript_94974/g.198493 Transcript_94974/m.198493 type:complete len:91 (-) Transcript_94974:1525-1797(-)
MFVSRAKPLARKPEPSWKLREQQQQHPDLALGPLQFPMDDDQIGLSSQHGTHRPGRCGGKEGGGHEGKIHSGSLKLATICHIMTLDSTSS